MSVKRVTFEKGLLRIEILFIFDKKSKRLARQQKLKTKGYSMESGLRQFVRFYFVQYQDDWLMHCKKDTVYLFKEGTETNLSRLELSSQYALASHQDVTQALVKFFNEDSEQKKK